MKAFRRIGFIVFGVSFLLTLIGLFNSSEGTGFGLLLLVIYEAAAFGVFLIFILLHRFIGHWAWIFLIAIACYIVVELWWDELT